MFYFTIVKTMLFDSNWAEQTSTPEQALFDIESLRDQPYTFSYARILLAYFCESEYASLIDTDGIYNVNIYKNLINEIHPYTLLGN